MYVYLLPVVFLLIMTCFELYILIVEVRSYFKTGKSIRVLFPIIFFSFVCSMFRVMVFLSLFSCENLPSRAFS